MYCCCYMCCFFFFNDTATTEIYTLSLHDALPIYITYVNTHQSKEPVTCFCVISRMKIALPNFILYNVIWHDIFCIIVDTQILHSAQRSIYKNKTILISNQSAINYFHYTKYLNKIVYIWYCEISQSCLHKSLKICLRLNITNSRYSNCAAFLRQTNTINQLSNRMSYHKTRKE